MHLAEPTMYTRVIAGKLFNPFSLEFLRDQVITVSEKTGLIHDVRPLASEANVWEWQFDKAQVVDLRHLTVLPGFVDAHVHFFLHPYSEVSWNDQLTKESLVERTIRATQHAKATLLAGFTTVRDLGTEGAGDADIALRKCMSGPNAIIPGPRYFCANRAIVPSGGYGPKGNLRPGTEGVDGITGATVADGVDECRRVVRKQIGAGADWIKVYADYRFRSRMVDVASKISKAPILMFEPDELRTIIKTASSYGVKVAAHSADFTVQGLDLAKEFDSIEHGYTCCLQSKPTTEQRLGEMFAQSNKTYWVPTLAAYYSMRDAIPDVWDAAQQTFRRALCADRAEHLKIACGGDTGVFAHGHNALELQLMVRLGADARRVLRWATLGGWECVRSRKWEIARPGRESAYDESSFEVGKRLERLMRGELLEARDLVGDNEMPFGAVRKGFSADLIATEGDLEADFERAVSAESISFVMKMGKICKRDGKPLI